MSHRPLAPLAVFLFCIAGPSHSQESQLRFDRLTPSGIEAYTDSILEPGRSRPASELIESFLGRPFTLDAWARLLAVP
jgi:hypothetical protein